MRTVDAAGLSIGDDHPPRIMGVLNVSQESPYDPSVYDDASEAAEYVDEELVGEGADIVDVGLESANKKFEVLSAEQELERLETAVQTIESVSGDAVYSIETRYHEVAEAALERGFDMVNDICGFADPEMPEVCAEYDVAVGKMASPPDLERPGAIEDVDWAERRSAEWTRSASYADKLYDALFQNGITDKTIVDPAFGGWSEEKTLENDRETFRRLREFRAIGQPILVSINRKNFLRSLADRSTEEALPVSLAATSMAVERGAHVVRTHDVAETRDAAIIGDEFARERVRSDRVEELDVTTLRDAQRHYSEASEDVVGAPAAAVSRVFALDLPADQRTALANAATEYDIAVADTGRKVVVGGPATALADLADAVTEPPALADALIRVREGCR